MASIAGFACLLLWLSIIDTYALSREAAVYNLSGPIAIVGIIVLGLFALAGDRLTRRMREVRAGACALGTAAGAAGLLAPDLIPLTFPVFAACAVPIAICWGMLLARQLVFERCRIVCAAGVLAAACGLAYNLADAVAWVGAILPLASCLCLRGAAGAGRTERTSDADRAGDETLHDGTDDAGGAAGANNEEASPESPGSLPRGHRLFMYTVCICTLLATIMCGMIASPVTANSQTPSFVMAAICCIGLALMLAAICATRVVRTKTAAVSKLATASAARASEDGSANPPAATGAPEPQSEANRGGSCANPDRAFAQLQLFGGLFEVVFVIGLVLLSTAQAGTMTTSVGIIIGARLCMAGVCWIMLPAGARRYARDASASRLAMLLAGCGTVFGTYAGAEIDRLCKFTFDQLTNMTTACIAVMAVIAVLYATLRARGMMPTGSGRGEVAAEGAAGAGAETVAGGGAATADGAAAGEHAAGDTAPKANSGSMQTSVVDAESLKQQIKAMRLSQISPFGLTERETQIVLLLLDGQTMKGIAEELFITERTVKFHSKNAYTKLGVASKKELMQKFSDLPAESAEEPLQPGK